MHGMCAGKVANEAHNIGEHGGHRNCQTSTNKPTELLVTLIFVDYECFIVFCHVQEVPICAVPHGEGIFPRDANIVTRKVVATDTPMKRR